MLLFNENWYLDHIWCGESEKIVPMARDQGVGQDLATVAKDEKIQLPMTVYAKIRYQDHIWYDEPENHPLNEQQQRGGQYLAADVMKLVKLYWLLDLSLSLSQ